MKDKDIKHLEWIYERMMKFVHNENFDYMIRFREILEVLRQPAVIKSGRVSDDYIVEKQANGLTKYTYCPKSKPPAL